MVCIEIAGQPRCGAQSLMREYGMLNMKGQWRRVSACLLIGWLPAAAWSQAAAVPATNDLGRAEYLSNCAGCHGPEGRGDGHFRDFLIRPPADLTTLSRRNDRVFPYQAVYQMIDGRTPVGSHGSREMPIWGADYRAQALTMSSPGGAPSPETYVRYRINLLLEYLYRIQQP